MLWNSGRGPGGVLLDKAVLSWLSMNLRSSSPCQEIIENAIGAPVTELIDQHIHLTNYIILEHAF